jgi:hypothetical protein
MGAGAPTKSELIVNLKTTKALGLAVPPLAAWTRRQGDRIEMPFAAAHESVHGTKLTWPAWSAMSGLGDRTEVGFRGRQVRI